jgi:cation-transporting ATPase E
MVIGLVVLFLVAQPLVPWKVALIASMGGLFALAMLIPKTREFFALFIPWTTLVEALVIGAAASALVVVTWKVARHRLEASAPRPPVSPD